MMIPHRNANTPQKVDNIHVSYSEWRRNLVKIVKLNSRPNTKVRKIHRQEFSLAMFDTLLPRFSFHQRQTRDRETVQRDPIQLIEQDFFGNVGKFVS